MLLVFFVLHHCVKQRTFRFEKAASQQWEIYITRPCEQGNWDTWMVLDPWNQV